MRAFRNPPPRPNRPQSSAVYRRALIEPPFVNGFNVSVLSPNGMAVRGRRPSLLIRASASDGGSVDIQVEWRTAPGGAVQQITNVSGVVSGTPTVVSPAQDLGYFTWYYRVRAGRAAFSTWGSWTPDKSLTIYPLPGFAHIYHEFNVGVENILVPPTTAEYLDFNIGLQARTFRDALVYSDFNVGLQEKPKLGAEYIELNVVPAVLGEYEASAYMDFTVDISLTPTPHIWSVRPRVGPEGMLFDIEGQGFGKTQGEFDGKVLLNGVVCNIADWAYVGESFPRAYKVAATLPTQEGTASRYDWTSMRAYNLGVVGPNGAPTVIQENAVQLATGDIIEFDFIRNTPNVVSETERRVIPFMKRRTGSVSTVDSDFYTLIDQNGVRWRDSHLYEGRKLHHRRFVVPEWLNNVEMINWGLALWGTHFANRPNFSEEFSNFVVRKKSGREFWVFGEDGGPVNQRYGQVTANIISDNDGRVSWSFPGLVPASNFFARTDTHGTTVPRERIVAVVPDGAESGMVRVVLEDD